MRSLAVWLILIPLAGSMHDLIFNEVRCTTSTKKSAEMSNCAINKQFLSFELNFLRSLDDWDVSINLIWIQVINFTFKLTLELFRRNGAKFSPIFKFPPVPWCPLNAGKSKFSGFQKLIQGIRSSVPQLFHKYNFFIISSNN